MTGTIYKSVIISDADQKGDQWTLFPVQAKGAADGPPMCSNTAVLPIRMAKKAPATRKGTTTMPTSNVKGEQQAEDWQPPIWPERPTAKVVAGRAERLGRTALHRMRKQHRDQKVTV